jgi:hypothetical protein
MPGASSKALPIGALSGERQDTTRLRPLFFAS